jgi:hypothetical protein
VLEGRVFIPVTRQLSTEDYFSWARTRPDNLLRTVEVAKQLLLADFPLAIASQEGRSADPAAILSVVNRIRDLYAQTVAYEKDSHAIATPDALVILHALQVGWTDPIRDGMQQMFQFLDTVLSLKTGGDHKVSFTIKIDAPANVEAFCHELDRLAHNLLG